MTAYNTIKADALLVEMAEDTPPFLLDVRTAAELEESDTSKAQLTSRRIIGSAH